MPEKWDTPPWIATASSAHVFDAAYPDSCEGDALVCHVGDTITIQNSHENEDITQSYVVPLHTGIFKNLRGKVGPHSYTLGKLADRGRRLWLQANTEYAERDSEITLTCAQAPQWKVEPPSAAREARWDANSGCLILRLSHAAGAAEVEIR